MSQAKIELSHLERLSKDMATYISMKLDKTDEPQQVKTGRRHFSIFRAPEIQTNRILAKLHQDFEQGNSKHIAKLAHVNPNYRRRVLFLLAGLGAQEEMQAILQEHPEELLVSRELTDISGAYFPSITLFQHCLWTKDVRYMANMMLDCLPKTLEGEEIRLALVEQYKVHQRNGVTYILDGRLHEGEHHFNIQPLITELQNYMDGYEEWSNAEADKHWCSIVGMEQRLLPAHIRHHYCDQEEAFRANVNLAKPKLKRTLEIYNWLSTSITIWSLSLDGLGRDFGMAAGSYLCSMCMCDVRFGSEIHENLAALTALDEMRTEVDFPALKKRLDTPMQLEALINTSMEKNGTL